MRKIIFVASVLICSVASGFAQSKTPIAVTTAFNQQFPNATNVKWDKENAHEYEASFEWKGEKLSANYSDNGEWLETESPISFDLLPEKVQSAFNSTHMGTSVKAVAKIETSKGISKFEVEFKQGVKTVELFYTTNGTELKE